MPSSVFPSITSNYENYPIFSSTSTVQETLQEPEYMQEQEFTQNEHEPTRLSGRVSSESDAFLFSRPRSEWFFTRMKKCIVHIRNVLEIFCREYICAKPQNFLV